LTFDNPRLLGFLFLLVVFIPIVIVRRRKNQDNAAFFASAAPSGQRKLLFREVRLRMLISDIFFMLFAGFLVLALAGPRWGVRIVADYRRGVDVILAFDLSRSMNVRDCLPLPPRNAALQGNSQDIRKLPDISGEGSISRLEKGVEIAREFVTALGDVRTGVVIGKGKAVLAVPLTYDFETVLNFLYSLDNMAVTGRGTNLESLVNSASASFQDSIPSRRIIILFSDGEALSGSFQAALEKARKAGIMVSAVGLGTDRGGAVPAEKGPDAPNGFIIAADGTPVISSLQGGMLKAGAEKSGGVYADGSRSDAVPVLAEYVNSLSAESRVSGYRREANPHWRAFILAALACLGGMRIMGFSRRTLRSREQKRGSKKGGGILLGLLCLVLFGSCARTQGKLLVMEGNFFNTRGFYTKAISSYLKALDYSEAVPYAEYGLASAYFALEENNAALERYRAAEQGLSESGEKDPELSYRIKYNMGVIHFEKGEYSGAVKAFRDALEVDGSRIEAKRNLELSLLTFNRSSSPQTASSEKTESGLQGANGNGSVLFEYLRQKEQEQWKSREWTGESESSGPDY